VAKCDRTFLNRLEIYQIARPITAIVQGSTLRIMDQKRFSVTYTTDNWATKTELDSRVVGLPGAFADIPTAQSPLGTVIFTLYWPEENRWLGYNCEISIQAEPVAQGTAADKPKS